MYRKLFFSAICFVFIAACNNSVGDKEEKGDSTANMTDHGHMDHTVPSGAIPELPPIPEGAKVIFSNLKNDQIIKCPFKIMMGTEGIGIDTAGPVVAGTGHHHLLINAGDSVAAGGIIPMDSIHVHFGKGQTEYELNLEPGKYQLTLQLADGLHRSYGSKLATSVNVTVKK